MSVSYSAISFRQIAGSYNAINALPPAAAAQLGAAIGGLAGAGGRILDMGCGAGRVAVPVAAAGGRVVGVDLELAMIQAARQSASPAARPPGFARADITRLPFADRSFSLVLSINVLHLVPAWQEVLAEAIRVLQPGGLFAQGRDWLDPASVAGRLRGKLREVVMTLEPGLRPSAAASPAVMAQALALAGGTTEDDLVAASWSSAQSPAELLGQMAARTHNETWMLSDELLQAALVRLRAWAEAEWGDLERALPVERRFTLTITRGLRPVDGQ